MLLFRTLFALVLCLTLLSGAETGVAEEDYRLASGDMIRIHVFGEEDLSMQIRLDATGVINYPFLGRFRVAGLTVNELESKLIQGLKDGYLKSPQVNVSIVEHRPFFIVGEVKKPGGYPYLPGLTVRKAISLAGGFTLYAARESFFVVYENQSDHSANRVDADAPIGPGDTITVDKSVFFISGEVKKPDAYPFYRGLTLREAVSLAGGLTERASERKISIISKDGTERPVNADDVMSTKIESGDSIRIRQSFF